MNHAIEKQEEAKICPVCEMSLEGVAEPIVYKTTDGELFFCSQKCFKEYLEDPELYGNYDEDEDEPTV